ncbi:M24 family metallopeptidase [Burkholderia ubonensis]|uniref:M24 family metallopeptidase n=1 Tax=Burkholderia ubonensis TaxID=101571 RepID=UPI00075DEB1E|nr:Xaa-Pro peptidase family protein [Burkholderia ubonensis]KUZ66068.1 X-Pro dipeptidase [Burkholderia ubonensis]
MAIGIGGSNAAAELAKLKDMTGGVEPIQPAEYAARVARAQALMKQHGLDAIYIESGTNLLYFTGVAWRRSERLAGALIPASGPLHYIVPAFERGTFTGMLQIPGDMHCWDEDADPYRLLASVIEQAGCANGTLGFDESAPYFMYEGIRERAAGIRIKSAAPVTSGCRLRKSAAELALMQRANDMTLRVHQAAAAILRDGIGTDEVLDFIDAAHRAVGARRGSTFCIVLFGPDTAFPHGVKAPKRLERNDMVLIDTGCQLHDYHSDITRTYVFGEASARQRDVWAHEKRAQAVAFERVRAGIEAQEGDRAVRDYLATAGYGPGYALPGVPHRTGHGIGLDIHEGPYLVGGERTVLDEGMCFSIEPMLCVPNEFGIRHEDHAYITADGPRWFTQPAKSIDDPFALG